ncbi:MAG TPA: MBL fold metallo-hydrolase [Longimicrobiales bacterium]|nr:MBL fold metallo-hydrolase [Longimicrobiales bacterium]
MKVTVLGSGSRGNAILVQADGVRILVDAGFSGKDLARRMAAVDVEPESITAMVITHDHGDHTRGMGIFARRFGTPIHLTPRTHAACAGLLRGDERVVEYDSARPFDLGPLRIQPFLTVHDAVDPVAITVTDTSTGSKLGVATDLGRPTATVRHALADSHLLVLEANHENTRLWEGPYPWSVKQRIASSHGHLSNRAAAELARELYHDGLSGVVLAHLSDSCNDPELARETIGVGLEATAFTGRLEVAAQDDPAEPIDVERLRQIAAPPQLSLF